MKVVILNKFVREYFEKIICEQRVEGGERVRWKSKGKTSTRGMPGGRETTTVQ